MSVSSIVAAGHRLVTEELTFTRTAGTIVELIRERLGTGRRAAGVPAGLVEA